MKQISIIFALLCFLFLPSKVLIAQSREQPVPISAPRPAYPPIAKAKHISGVVLIDVVVNPEGRVTEAVILMGGDYIKDSAKKSALNWRFKALESSTSNYSVRLTFIFHEYEYKPPEQKPDFISPYLLEILY
jgi:TonB family protein